jgi:hypothetical protein
MKLYRYYQLLLWSFVYFKSKVIDCCHKEKKYTLQEVLFILNKNLDN